MPHSRPLPHFLFALWQRTREALCLATEPAAGGPAGGCERRPKGAESEKGSAVVEFTFLAVLLMVPVVYFVVTVGQIQGGSFAVVGAADQAAKVFVAGNDVSGARAAAERAVLLALGDYGHVPEQATVEVACDRADCLSAGSTVTVTVSLDVPLPLMPSGNSPGLTAARLSASATQVVGRFL